MEIGPIFIALLVGVLIGIRVEKVAGATPDE